jgi:WD40 repeat protein
MSADGSLIAGSALYNDLRIWDAKTGAEKFKLLGNGRLGGTRLVRFSPDGKRLVAWGDDFYLRVWDMWDMRNGKLLSEHRTIPEGATEADLDDDRAMIRFLGMRASDISADGTTFAFCSYKVVQVFDVQTGKERAKFEADANGVGALAVSPDGKSMLVAGRQKATLERLPDGRQKVVTDKTHAIKLWNLAERKVIWTREEDGSGTYSIAFTPDGSRFATSTFTSKPPDAVRIRDVATGKEVGHFDTDTPVYHLAFDLAGKRLAVAKRDTTATIYDLATALKPGAPK